MTGQGVSCVADGVHVAAAAISLVAGAPVAPADLHLTAASGQPVRRTRERLAARALLRRLLAQIAGPDAAASPLAARPGGRPYLPDRPDLAVSLSHTDEWVAAAVATDGRRAGVDVQAAVAPGEGLLRRCCTPAARAVLAGLPEPARAVEFAWVWSVQEACVKATGDGIAGLPWLIPVEIGQHAGRWRNLNWSALRGWLPIPVSCAYDRSPGAAL